MTPDERTADRARCATCSQHELVDRLADENNQLRAKADEYLIARDAERCTVDDLAAELRDARAEIERLKEETFPATWDGLIGFLDCQYPSDVFTGASADPGPQIVALTRELAAERAKVQRAMALCDPHGPNYTLSVFRQQLALALAGDEDR